MDMEEEIVAFGETALWVECDICGSAFGGLSLDKAIVTVRHINVCINCTGKPAFLLAIVNARVA